MRAVTGAPVKPDVRADAVRKFEPRWLGAALTVLGPGLVDADAILMQKQHATAARAVRLLAIQRNSAAFLSNALPPLLVDQSARALECTFDAYRPGPFTAIARKNRVLRGAVMMTDGDVSMPALLYTAVLTGVDTLVCHVFDAPVAMLEAAIADGGCAAPTPVEARWLGEELAARTRALRASATAACRSRGLDGMSGTLLDGNYHVLREGPLPFLHLRSARTDAELETLERLCHAALMYEPSTQPPERSTIDVESEQLDCTALLTVFDRAKEEWTWLSQRVTPVETGAASCDAMCEEQRVHACQLASCDSVLLWAAAAVLTHDLPSDSARGCAAFEHTALQHARKVVQTSVTGATEMGRTKREHSINDLAAACPGTHALNRVACPSIAETDLHRLSSVLFNAADAALAVRDLRTWVSTGPDSAESNGLVALRAIARRVATPCAVLVVVLAPGSHVVERMSLINAAVDRDDLALDEAMRLMTCPWVTPVVYSARPVAHPTGLLVFQQPRVTRHRLQVTDAVRATYHAVPSVPARFATPADVEHLRRDMCTHLATLQNAVQDLVRNAPKPSVAVVPPPPPPPPPPLTANVSAILSTLDRLLVVVAAPPPSRKRKGGALSQ